MSQTFNTIRVIFSHSGKTLHPTVSSESVHKEMAVWWRAVRFNPTTRAIVSGALNDANKPSTDNIHIGIQHLQDDGSWARNEEITDFTSEIID